MRFQFCGHTSCPEWFIAEISVLTKITAVKIKLIFAQLITHYLEGTDISAKSLKLLAGTGLDSYQMNAVIATLNFILHNSVMFQVSESQLNKELVDLGLPKENVESITKAFKANRQKLIGVSLQKQLRISKQVQMDYSIHQFVGSSNLPQRRSVRFAECELKYRDKQDQKQQINFVLCEAQLDDLIYQLSEALSTMQKIQGKAHD